MNCMIFRGSGEWLLVLGIYAVMRYDKISSFLPLFYCLSFRNSFTSQFQLLPILSEIAMPFYLTHHQVRFWRNNCTMCTMLNGFPCRCLWRYYQVPSGCPTSTLSLLSCSLQLWPLSFWRLSSQRLGHSGWWIYILVCSFSSNLFLGTYLAFRPQKALAYRGKSASVLCLVSYLASVPLWSGCLSICMLF